MPTPARAPAKAPAKAPVAQAAPAPAVAPVAREPPAEPVEPQVAKAVPKAMGIATVIMTIVIEYNIQVIRYWFFFFFFDEFDLVFRHLLSKGPQVRQAPPVGTTQLKVVSAGGDAGDIADFFVQVRRGFQ